MYSVRELLLMAARSIQRRVPDGDPQGLAALEAAYGELSKAYFASRDASIDATRDVTGSTSGRASDAFERFSHRHTRAVRRHGETSTFVQHRVHDYSEAIQVASDRLLPLHKDVLNLLTVEPITFNKVELLQQARQRVRAAIEITDDLEKTAERLGKRIANTVDDLELPVPRKRNGLAFTGGYKLGSGTVEIDRYIVSQSAKRFDDNGQELLKEVSAHERVIEGPAERSIGTDPPGRAFAKGYRVGAADLVIQGKRTVRQVKFIRSGLKGMVIRHNRAEEEALRRSGELVATIGPVKPTVPTGPGTTWVHGGPLPVGTGTGGAAAPDPAPAGGTGTGGAAAPDPAPAPKHHHHHHHPRRIHEVLGQAFPPLGPTVEYAADIRP